MLKFPYSNKGKQKMYNISIFILSPTAIRVKIENGHFRRKITDEIIKARYHFVTSSSRDGLWLAIHTRIILTTVMDAKYV